MPDASRAAPDPRISIITPSFNQAEFIEHTIRSVISQEYPDLEYIVVDGDSTDGTAEILERYEGAGISRCISEPDNGQSDALNKGFACSTGEIIGWLNSDDTYQPGTLREVANCFRDPLINVVMSEYFGFLNSEGKIYGRKKNEYRDFRTLVRYWRTNGMTINQPCVFFRRGVIDSFNPVVDTGLHYAMDYDLWLRIARDYPIRVVPGHWANYRFHDGSKSGRGFESFYPEWHQVSRRYWGRRYSSEWWRHCLDWNVYRLSGRLARVFTRG